MSKCGVQKWIVVPLDSALSSPLTWHTLKPFINNEFLNGEKQSIKAESQERKFRQRGRWQLWNSPGQRSLSILQVKGHRVGLTWPFRAPSKGLFHCFGIEHPDSSLPSNTDVLETEIFLLPFWEVYKREVHVTLNKLLVAPLCSLWLEPSFLSWHWKASKKLKSIRHPVATGRTAPSTRVRSRLQNNEVAKPKTIF